MLLISNGPKEHFFKFFSTELQEKMREQVMQQCLNCYAIHVPIFNKNHYMSQLYDNYGKILKISKKVDIIHNKDKYKFTQLKKQIDENKKENASEINSLKKKN